MNDTAIFFGACIMFFIVILGVVGALDYAFDRGIKCPHFAANVERPWRYDYFGGGCFVQTEKGQWVQSKNYWNNVTDR